MLKAPPALAERILALKVGQSFLVKRAQERNEVYAAIRTLRDTGNLKHEIKTTTTPAGFKIYAI